MFSKACTYSIRAMMFIVSRTRDGSKVGIKEIAQHTGTPEPFVAKILQELSKRGIVSSVKGRNGGFYIDPTAPPIPLLDIVLAIDGNSFFVNCGLGIKNCSEKRPCPIHNEYKSIRDETHSMLKRNTIQDLAAGLVSGKTFLLKN
ncbi:MAG TPA: Rrf2 family transcriptional regulator [Cyclobacteriaceae bacterium]|nr:Rrf2 family transcriptional regulator [Cyclobacteriaceae bacterium]